MILPLSELGTSDEQLKLKNSKGLDISSTRTMVDAFNPETISESIQCTYVGLGLLICKKLCYVQENNTRVFSEEDKGSAFTFWVKVGRAINPHRLLSWPSKVKDTVNEFATAQDGRTGVES